MPNEIIRVFESADFGALRVSRGEDGEPWFVAKDVCAALGIATDHVRRGLDEDEVTNLPNWQNGGKAPLVVSEAGLYSLILKSRKPEARAFKRWITHEVLPAIRRDGGYMVAKEDETPEETMARAVLIAQKTIERQRGRIAELEPKALFADAVTTSRSTILVNDLAKILRQNGLEIGGNRLFAMLREQGYLCRQKGAMWNMPTQRSMEMGLFKVKETAVTHSDGHVTVNKTPKVTGKGQIFFINKFCGDGHARR